MLRMFSGKKMRRYLNYLRSAAQTPKEVHLNVPEYDRQQEEASSFNGSCPE